MISHTSKCFSNGVCVGIQREMQLYVRGKPASLSSDPPDVTTHRGADCCDYTKNKTRKKKYISEKENSIRKMCFMCVLHHYEKPVTHKETRV